MPSNEAPSEHQSGLVRRPLRPRLSKLLLSSEIRTPAYVYDVDPIMSALAQFSELRQQSLIHLVYPLKALALAPLLAEMVGHLDGFAASSPFEARLAHQLLCDRGTVHYTSPGIRPDDFDDLRQACTHISFNSLSQWDAFRSDLAPTATCGLRVNPQISFLIDRRYDPCRPGSKLGISPTDIADRLAQSTITPNSIQGLHFHSNCDSDDVTQLQESVNLLEATLPELFRTMQWINLGGGYLYRSRASLLELKSIASHLSNHYGLTVFIEPGAALVRSAGYLVSSVLDIFDSDGSVIAVLDTTVNHAPEVFEYQYEPDLWGHLEHGRYSYVLAGLSCLAGDVFGEYSLDSPLNVGDRVVFLDMGSYSYVKAHMFNGINLPNAYLLDETGTVQCMTSFGYSHFTNLNGVNQHASD